MKILLVDDDEMLTSLLTKSLHQYVIDTVQDGEMGWTYGSTFEYDLMVLDIMLPKLDGISLCRRFRDEGYTTPILLLTSQDSSTAKVSGLDAGADDYVVKPCDVAELSARIRALLRRSSVSPLPLLTWGDLLLNPSSCEVSYNGQPVTLTTKEYELLELMMRASQHVFSTDEILGRLWSSEEFPSEATVRSHVRRLRNKLVGVGAPADFVATVHGRGYYLKAPLEKNDSQMGSQSNSQDSYQEGSQSNSSVDSQVQTEQEAHYWALMHSSWLAYQPRALEELEMIEAAIAADQDGQLSSDIRADALAFAHKVCGTVGTFGLHQGSQIARQMEQELSQSAPAIDRLRDLLEALRQEIQQATQPMIRSSLVPGQVPPYSMPTAAEPDTKVMVVDDDRYWLQALPQLLSPWGFKLTTLADPQQFWVVLQAVVPDVLVLDIDMPEISGLELCEAVRADPNWQRLPILFLSSLGDQATQNQAFALGADDYLCKPISAIDLANRILNRLRRVKAWSHG